MNVIGVPVLIILFGLTHLLGAFSVALLLWGVLAIVQRPPSDRSERPALPKVDTSAVDTVAFGSTVLTRSDTWMLGQLLPAK